MAGPFATTTIDRSGTITSGGTSQQLMLANPQRSYLFIQNLSTGALWINFGTTAVQAQPSIQIPAVPSAFVMEAGYVSKEAINIIGATTGQAWVGKEA